MPDNQPVRRPQVLLAPDKFRSTATAAELRETMASAARKARWSSHALPLTDGGEGLLAAYGGEEMVDEVTGPLGTRVQAKWRIVTDSLGVRTAVIEMAEASGMALIGNVQRNDPIAATTFGTGELIVRAIEAGASKIVVGCGGSATTDGGQGAIEAIGALLPNPEISLVVACDVKTTFVDAAKIFGPQKGATPEQVVELTERLRSMASEYQAKNGTDIAQLPWSGAAGGLSGGLHLLGGQLISGFSLVAEALHLDQQILKSDLVITGEGRLDDTSLSGKVVGELVSRCAERCPIAVIVGDSSIELEGATVISLTKRFGPERAKSQTLELVRLVTSELLSNFNSH